MLEDFGELSRADPRTDEQLVSDFLVNRLPDGTTNPAGKQAMAILLARYQPIVLAILCGDTWFPQDKSYVDDLRQEVLITIYLELSRIESGFAPTGPGSFKKWVYRIAHYKALNRDKKRRKDFKLTSEIFSADDTAIPDDLLFNITPTSTDYEEIEEQLKDIASKLDGEELDIMTLLCTPVARPDGTRSPMQYAEIQQLDKYKDKYSVDALKQKVYNIRKKIREG